MNPKRMVVAIEHINTRPNSMLCIKSGMGALVVLLLLFIYLPGSVAHATKSEYRLVGQPLATIYTPKEHGGHNQNWTSIQSRNGFIYIGHTQGISQWDGEEWINYTTPQLTPVRSISEFNNALYFGTTNDIFRLQTNDAGILITTSIIDLSDPVMQDFGEIWSSAANSHGVIFVSEEQVFFHDGTTTQYLPDVAASPHGIFNIDDDFYFKVRHLPYLYKLSVVKDNDQLRFTQRQLPLRIPENARVMEILQGADGKLTLITERHGVFQVIDDNIIQVILSEAFAKDVQLYDAILSSDGYYYISSTYSGLFILDAKLNILRRYIESDGISMNTVFSVNEDLQGNIWLTGIPNVTKMRPPHLISQFKAGDNSTEILKLTNSDVGIFASGNGVFKLKVPAIPMMTPYFEAMSDSQENSVDLLKYQDTLIKAGHSGVYELTLNATNSSISQETRLIDVSMGRIIQRNPANEQLLISSDDGAFVLENVNGNWQYQIFPHEMNNLISLVLDRYDTLWLGSATSQLFKFDKVSQFAVAADLTEFTQQDGLGLGPVSLFDVDNEVIVSSAGKLLSHRDGKLTETTLPMFTKEWLSDANIIDQLEQSDATIYAPERLWYRKNGRSGYFEKQQTQWLERTEIFDSVPSGGFYDLFVNAQDILWFVRDKAEIYRVNIALAQQLPPIAPLNIRRMESNNDIIDFKVKPGSRIALLPEQKNLRFSYASTDSSSPKPIRYRTRLADGDKASWSSWSEETYRDFTQLVPNHYRLQVQAKDAWGRSTETYLDIAVIAPWYLSKTAYMVYVGLGMLLVLGFAWLVQKWRTVALEAANKALEVKVEARTKEVNEKVEELRQQQILKDRFFGNVSHEFRTPLTLTIGPLETLISEHQSELSQPVTHLAKTALSNASKMLALVGQVLDLNRLEAGKLPLRIAQYDLAELLRNIRDRFRTWAKQHEQVIESIDCDEPLLLWFDIDQLDKCVSNLLSNAIKYSGRGTLIQLVLRKQGEVAEIEVRDNGVGISEGAKRKVFERFFQDKSSENVSTPGTGIGLSLVKELMEIHHGDARLANSAEKGCCFILTLKTGNQHFDPEQIIEPIEVSSINEQNGLHEQNSPTKIQSKNVTSSGEAEDVTTLLIVDDNQELLNFISLRLSTSFKILQAVNGQDGYEKACKYLPDLIISDVNMPVMTGLVLAEKIKRNPQTKTIPIILLTAKATKREVVEGFSVGADDYLTKPFDTSELIMRVNAQINARKLVRETHTATLEISGTLKPSTSFKEKLLEIVTKQIGDPEFNVELLSLALHMSRDTLIRRCKKDFGDTPLNIIVEKRMQRADKLLVESHMSISEVAYACGFESLAYFSKSYKKQRGLSPSDVKSSQ